MQDKTSKIKGHISPISKAQLEKAKIHLRDLVNYGGKVMSRAEMVHVAMCKKWCPMTRVEPRIKDMSRMAYFRANNEEQRDHETRQRKAGNKTIYMIGSKDSSVDITKTQYRYAMAEFYRDFDSNFHDVRKLADYYSISLETATEIVEQGRISIESGF